MLRHTKGTGVMVALMAMECTVTATEVTMTELGTLVSVRARGYLSGPTVRSTLDRGSNTKETDGVSTSGPMGDGEHLSCIFPVVCLWVASDTLVRWQFRGRLF